MPRTDESDSEKLSVALGLLREILKTGTNHNRRYCVYCKVTMSAPVELHKRECAWRRAWQLVNTGKV